MLHTLPRSVHQIVSAYLDQADRINLLYMNKYMHSVWLLEVCLNYTFVFSWMHSHVPNYLAHVRKIFFDLNQKIEAGVLPIGLQSLQFGYYYNKKIEVGVLPIGLQSLRFGCNYNQKIEAGVLPIGLQSLQFGSHYNQKIEAGVLPIGLQSLQFGWNYNQK